MKLGVRRAGLALGAILGMAVSLFAAAQAYKSPVPFVKIGGASVGTTNYQLAIKFADIWGKVPGLTATALPGSAISNQRDIALNRIQVGMTSMKTQYDAIRGIGGYEKYEGLRYILPWQMSNMVWVVRADSDIKTLADLKDKHVMPGAQGSTSQQAGLLMLEANGITPESIRRSGGQLSYGAVGNNVTMMQDKQLDAMLITIPQKGMYSPILPIENNVGVRLIPVDDKTLQYVLDRMPTLRRSSVDGGIYKNQPGSYRTVAEGYAWTARADIPDDLVYELVKRIWDSADDIVRTNPHFYAYGDINNALEMANVPLHPGAVKYYTERGIKIPAELMPPK